MRKRIKKIRSKADNQDKNSSAPSEIFDQMVGNALAKQEINKISEFLHA